MTPVQLAVLSFLVVGGVTGAAVALLLHRQSRTVQARLASLTAGPGAHAGPVSVIADDRPTSPIERVLYLLGRRSAAAKDDAKEEEETTLRPRDKAPGVPELLVQAGFRKPNAYVLFMGMRVLLALSVLGLGLLVAAVVNPALMGSAFCFAAAGYVLPGIVLGRMASARRVYIRQTLPDTLDLLLLCVEAGLGLNAALLRVAEERLATAEHDPLGEELQTTSKELQVGLARREALRNLANRTGSNDLRQLAAQLIQSEKLGSSVSQTLRVQADAIRTARKLEAEELANKVQIKLLFPLILFIFPTVMIVILFPAGIRLMAALGTLL